LPKQTKSAKTSRVTFPPHAQSQIKVALYRKLSRASLSQSKISLRRLESTPGERHTFSTLEPNSTPKILVPSPENRHQRRPSSESNLRIFQMSRSEEPKLLREAALQEH
jgi:hypothetical protein